MKYLPYEEIEEINNQLSCIDNGDTRMFGRMECYSCKQTREDMKLKHHLESKFEPDKQIMIPLSPKSPTTLGPLSGSISRKTFLYLLGTLNAVYPDYDFSDVKPEYFQKVPSLGIVMNNVNNSLLIHFKEAKISSEQAIWESMDRVIDTKSCDIYAFIPPREVEPDSEEGNLWSFFYFFYNKPEKRIVFFTARAVSLLAPLQPEEEQQYYQLDTGTPPYNSVSYDEYTMDTMDTMEM